ncbi:hypothetical protein HMPREF1861_00927 [Corynebacterium kroppenstedtii]|nr:hypothetical protein HMPREF1861_00927 [Corynebacterium kroppenstedtii]
MPVTNEASTCLNQWSKPVTDRKRISGQFRCDDYNPHIEEIRG